MSAILTQGQEINWQDKEAAMTQLQSLKVLDADQRRLARELQRQMSSARTDRFAGLNRLAEYQSNRGFEGAADLQARLGAEQAKATATKINLPEILTDANLPTEDDVRREASGGIGKFMDSRAITDPAARERFQKALGVYLAPSGEVVESQPTAPNALDTKTTPDLIDRGGLYDRFTQKQAIADVLTKRWAEVMVAAREDPSVLEQALTLDILRRVAQDALQAEQNALKRVYKGANRNALRAAKRELNAATNEKTGLENKAKATPRGWKVLQAASRVPQGLLAPLGFGGRLLQGIGSTAEKLSESADKIPQIVNASALEAQQARATQLAPDVATATTRAATAEANVKNLEALARGLDPAQTAADQQATAEQSRVVDSDQ